MPHHKIHWVNDHTPICNRFDLKEQKDTIKGQFEDTLGELKWAKKRIGFLDNTVGDVSKADTDREFPWLHDRLVKLHAVFQPLVGETP